MSRLEFDVAKRQMSIMHGNGARSRRFAIDPIKATWYSVYRCARLALHGCTPRDGAAAMLALKAYAEVMKSRGALP